MKKIIIIGAGISGLTAGVFAREMGFETEIYESHSIPGGECTGWSRGGYHFDNCIHWLTGTNKETTMYKVWERIGAIENIELISHDYSSSITSGEEKIYLYRDINKLQDEFLRVAPHDMDEILKLIDVVKKMQHLSVPSKKPMDMMKIFDYMELMKEYKGVSKEIAYLSKISIGDYASKFSSEILRKAISSCVPKEYNAMTFAFTLATASGGNGRYPKGGSLKLSMRIENKYKSLGGKVNYGAKASKIIIENGVAKGILLESGETILGDYIISSVDANVLMEKLLENKYKDKIFDIILKDKEKYPILSSVGVFLGVKCDLSHRDHTASFNVDPFKCGTQSIDSFGLKHYCYEPNFAPKGCSVLNINIMGSDYDYFKKLKEENIEQYNIEKDNIAKAIIERVEKIYPETKGNIEVYDVNTPVTYERYCSAHKGAWMACAPKAKAKSLRHAGRIKGVKNLHVAGQWCMIPGGLPSAAVAGKWAIQRICKDEKIEFPFKY